MLNGKEKLEICGKSYKTKTMDATEKLIAEEKKGNFVQIEYSGSVSVNGKWWPDHYLIDTLNMMSRYNYNIVGFGSTAVGQGGGTKETYLFQKQ